MARLTDEVVADVEARARAVPQRDGAQVTVTGDDAAQVQAVGAFVLAAQPQVVAALAAEVLEARARAVPEDNLRRLEQLLEGAKQADAWAWLEAAREDVPKLIAEVRAQRAAQAPAQSLTPAERADAEHALLVLERDAPLGLWNGPAVRALRLFLGQQPE